jgi:hypothetical protein
MTTNNTATASATTGFPVLGLAFAVLFVLKVAGQAGASWGLANLSWWIVFSPLLLGFGLSLFILLVILFIAFVSNK